ncbi:MAG: S9 family peptidase [Candidatus Eremiobacteraeota bacterium]|nr:S9 family peptidase [Candidatus Eremiobacteraeota bacterium]
MRRVLGILLFLLMTGFSWAGEGKVLTFETLMQFRRISAPIVSPDGSRLVFVVSRADLEANLFNSDLWIAGAAGGMVRQFTQGSGKDGSPAWSPDGKRIVFVSDRGGKDQLYLIDIGGGEAWQLTKLSTGAADPLWSPDGKYILFTSTVYPECAGDEGQKKKLEEEKASRVKAKVYESLLYRHWDHFRNGKRSHLFIVSAAGGTERDLTAGADSDVPPLALGGRRDFCFSPDSREICYTANTDKMLTLSTNNDLFVIPAAGGKAKRITANAANDNQPLYSPDGAFIAYRAQMKAGYESDRYRLMLYERGTGTVRNLTEPLDRSVDEVIWAPDSRGLYFTAMDEGYSSLYRVSTKGNDAQKLLGGSYNHSFSLSPDGKRFYFLRESSARPAEIFTAPSRGGEARELTFLNQGLVSRLAMRAAEEFSYPGAGGARVHGFLIKPPGFDAGKKYPLVLLIHGGPQQMWGDTFGASWNPQVFAACGFVVAKINPRGSEGYGQQFCDEINRDWGGKPYEDLMSGVDFLVSRYPFIDQSRLGAAGASYGGYMVNWIAGHTTRFKCLISIAGCYNLTGKYGATDELWFPEWEFGGPPWSSDGQYEKWSPSSFAASIKTPTLVIHGQQDFRVPVTEGMAMFTTLQRQGIPSQFLYFPDEGHWISKPLNLELYLATIRKWLEHWLGK